MTVYTLNPDDTLRARHPERDHLAGHHLLGMAFSQKVNTIAQGIRYQINVA